jgi:transcriptional regulator with XRE-family HTH domain
MPSSVTQYVFPTSLPWSEKLVSKLSAPRYRHAYMTEGVKTWIARQVRTLREQRDWSQEDLGRQTGKPQSAISRVEDPDYGKLTLQTLFDLARAYDLPLLVQFVEWSDWLVRMDDVSTEVLRKESFSATALSDLGTGQISYNGPTQTQLAIDPFEQERNQHLGVNYQTSNIGLLLSNLKAVEANAWAGMTESKLGGIKAYGDYGQSHLIFEDTNKAGPHRDYDWDFEEQFPIPANKALEISEA